MSSSKQFLPPNWIFKRHIKLFFRSAWESPSGCRRCPYRCLPAQRACSSSRCSSSVNKLHTDNIIPQNTQSVFIKKFKSRFGPCEQPHPLPPLRPLQGLFGDGGGRGRLGADAALPWAGSQGKEGEITNRKTAERQKYDTFASPSQVYIRDDRDGVEELRLCEVEVYGIPLERGEHVLPLEPGQDPSQFPPLEQSPSAARRCLSRTASPWWWSPPRPTLQPPPRPG